MCIVLQLNKASYVKTREQGLSALHNGCEGRYEKVTWVDYGERLWNNTRKLTSKEIRLISGDEWLTLLNVVIKVFRIGRGSGEIAGWKLKPVGGLGGLFVFSHDDLLLRPTIWLLAHIRRIIICPIQLNGYVLNKCCRSSSRFLEWCLQHSDSWRCQGRFSARGLNTGLLERSLLFDHQSLSKDDYGSWCTLLQDPLNLLPGILQRLLHLKISTSTSPQPSSHVTIFYIRTFTFTVAQLRNF